MTHFSAQPRLLVLSSGFPYPVDAGRKTVLSGFLDFAVDTLGRDNVLLLCISSDKLEATRTQMAPCRVAFFRPAGAVIRLGIAAIMSLLLRRRAIQETLLAAPGTSGRVASLLEGFDPAIILVDTIRMVQHLPDRLQDGCRRVLYLDDLYSLRYQRVLAVMRKHPDAGINPLGTFARFVPRGLHSLMRGSLMQRRLLTHESAVLAHRERAMPRMFDQVLLLNAHETHRLCAETGAQNVATIKPVLKQGVFRCARCFDGRPSFLFLGNLGYSANSYGLLLFLQQAMPKLAEARPDAELLVVGKGASAMLKAAAARFGTQVRFLDYVEDIEAFTSTCAAIIVPLAFGTGIKIKVMDALSRGVPLVSTPTGVDGLDLEGGVHCLIEEEIPRFPAAMLRLLDPVLNARMSEAGRAYYDEHLSPEAAYDNYRLAILGRVQSVAPPPASELIPDLDSIPASALAMGDALSGSLAG